MKMLLAVDIGNTNITLGLYRGRRIIRQFQVPTRGYSVRRLRQGLGRDNIEEAIICSVVPKSTEILTKDLKSCFGARPLIIGKDIRVPIRNLYRYPRQVGQDRLVNAYAAAQFYGTPAIVIDFGTAVTFDIVSRQKAYLGGMILPGLQMSLEALAEKTALLPKVSLDEPMEFIGRETENSILSGVIYGLAALTDALTLKIKDKIGKEAKVIGTGGNISLMRRFCAGIEKIDSGLTLKGLLTIYRLRQEAKKNT